MGRRARHSGAFLAWAVLCLLACRGSAGDASALTGLGLLDKDAPQHKPHLTIVHIGHAGKTFSRELHAKAEEALRSASRANDSQATVVEIGSSVAESLDSFLTAEARQFEGDAGASVDASAMDAFLGSVARFIGVDGTPTLFVLTPKGVGKGYGYRDGLTMLEAEEAARNFTTASQRPHLDSTSQSRFDSQQAAGRRFMPMLGREGEWQDLSFLGSEFSMRQGRSLMDRSTGHIPPEERAKLLLASEDRQRSSRTRRALRHPTTENLTASPSWASEWWRHAWVDLTARFGVQLHETEEKSELEQEMEKAAEGVFDPNDELDGYWNFVQKHCPRTATQLPEECAEAVDKAKEARDRLQFTPTFLRKEDKDRPELDELLSGGIPIRERALSRRKAQTLAVARDYAFDFVAELLLPSVGDDRGPEMTAPGLMYVASTNRSAFPTASSPASEAAVRRVSGGLGQRGLSVHRLQLDEDPPLASSFSAARKQMLIDTAELRRQLERIGQAEGGPRLSVAIVFLHSGSEPLLLDGKSLAEGFPEFAVAVKSISSPVDSARHQFDPLRPEKHLERAYFLHATTVKPPSAVWVPDAADKGVPLLAMEAGVRSATLTKVRKAFERVEGGKERLGMVLGTKRQVRRMEALNIASKMRKRVANAKAEWQGAIEGLGSGEFERALSQATAAVNEAEAFMQLVDDATSALHHQSAATRTPRRLSRASWRVASLAALGLLLAFGFRSLAVTQRKPKVN